ncbi:uncharacterized protein IUM83_04906 [Phytophthora cinnamomi]|uniref:uncharacterized protein n=1 Tax=Phytophthora cinnamomi TaxID=4785 RepID=UPI00355A065C|nr:hypothetical protein IUM83_04906 [Phytophthora cinnamomi]
MQETTTRTAVIQGGETRRKVEALVQHSAAAHQRHAEKIGQVKLQQDRLAAQTSEYLQAQHERQAALLERQNEMRRQMDEHRKYLEEQYKILKEAEQAVGLQGQRLENLAEAVQPHPQARWGAFAQGAEQAADERMAEAAAVTVAAGTNLPVPPIYRGSSKKEKREFMDSYAIYTRRIKALNQGTQAKFFVMPISACIEQGTLVRICDFELFKAEKGITEAEWKNYFLTARIPDNTAYKTLDREVKSLCMDVELQDAESRLSRLLADFYEITDRLNMEDVVHTEPKKVFAMAAFCQEIYSILTEAGVITPTRVLMGGTNSVAYVQSTVQQMFAEVFNNGLMIWIDDLLGYEDSDEGLLVLLKKVLTICADKGLKLNPKSAASSYGKRCGVDASYLVRAFATIQRGLQLS